jgi:N,N'-diacetyllegionaminate synthase
LSVKIIAEIGSNWEGDMELAKLHIKEAKESGADYVKFQMWRAEDLYNSDHPEWEMIKKSELTENIALELKKYADEINIGWFCSAFNPDAVEFLEKIGVSIHKIASRTATLNDKFSLETIKKIAETKKNTFVSMGEGGDKNKILELFQKKSLKFTYCISKYPTDANDIDWNIIKNYNFFSDHTNGIIIPLVYSMLKINNKNEDIFIEKHTKFENSKGPDSTYAITYEELKQLTDHIKRIEKTVK